MTTKGEAKSDASLILFMGLIFFIGLAVGIFVGFIFAYFMLKKTDPKKNRFTIDVIADDKTVEKKDKTINEPVQLYVGGARQPYEIVVNEVKKDTITGYVAVPKVLRAAR